MDAPARTLRGYCIRGKRPRHGRGKRDCLALRAPALGSQPRRLGRKDRLMQTPTNREQLYASYGWYRQMRETQSVSLDPDWGACLVFRYADVARVLSDHTTFSSDEQRYGSDAFRDKSPIRSSILYMDPPRHRQMRSLVSQAFTPRMLTHMEARITEITTALLDQVEAQGEMDVIRDLAYPLPVTVIAELLGIPTERRDDFKRWSDALVAGGEEITEEES